MHSVREWLAGGPVEGVLATLAVHQAGSSRTPAQTFLGNHDVARLADVVQPDLLGAAFAVLLTVPGVPSVYYGDEVALTSSWTRGGADALLRPRLSVQDVDRVDGAASDLLDTVRTLGEFRGRRPWLTRARLTDLDHRDGVVSYRCVGQEGDLISVHVNAAREDVVRRDVAGTTALGTASGVVDGVLHLPPRSWAVLT